MDGAAFIDMHVLRFVGVVDVSENCAVTAAAELAERSKNSALAIGARPADKWVIERMRDGWDEPVARTSLGPCVVLEVETTATGATVHRLSDSSRWHFAVLQHAAVVALGRK